MKTRKKVNKRNTTLYLAPAQRAALAQISERRDVSMGFLIREAIAYLIKREAKREQ
jgi:predicted transcriptional regulator